MVWYSRGDLPGGPYNFSTQVCYNLHVEFKDQEHT
jgi:hypothetical protein